ncbi:hypothetical protein [Dictyobacter arantiisoli]|uniref:Uncharacterized protein n=1 Tax=Dictyobacter arantiisoli TaxID=2014874 RepID=A0A5A5TAB2_9CHLR|nr:hypothetical protein [Dictyobacter arantiisoli]GCF08096.1 hypothetical protein KDI_16600 [Dictyobacter arantiisoli]
MTQRFCCSGCPGGWCDGCVPDEQVVSSHVMSNQSCPYCAPAGRPVCAVGIQLYNAAREVGIPLYEGYSSSKQEQDALLASWYQRSDAYYEHIGKLNRGQ